MAVLLSKLLSSWRNAGFLDPKERRFYFYYFNKNITSLLSTEHNSPKYRAFIKIAAQALESKSECIEQVCGDPSASTINIVTLLILLKTTAENQEKGNVNDILLSTLRKASESKAPKEIDILMKETVNGLRLALEDEGGIFQEAFFNVACDHGHCETMKLLLTEAGDIDTKKAMLTDDDYEVFKLACYRGHCEVVELLLAEAGDIDIATKEAMLTSENYMAFKLACENGHIETVELLLAKAGDIDIATKEAMLTDNDYSAFKLACSNGHIETVELLLAEAGDIDTKKAMLTDNDYRAFKLACKNGHIETVKLLLAKAGDIDSDTKKAMLTDDGYEAFQLACKNGHIETVKLLLAEAGNIDIATKEAMLTAENYMAFKLACENEYLNIAQYLLRESAITEFFADQLLTTQPSNNKELFIKKLSRKCQDDQFSLNEFALWHFLTNYSVLLTRENITSLFELGFYQADQVLGGLLTLEREGSVFMIPENLALLVKDASHAISVAKLLSKNISGPCDFRDLLKRISSLEAITQKVENNINDKFVTLHNKLKKSAVTHFC